MGGQPPVNVRGVGERHNIVRQTDSGFGVDARVNPGGPLRPIPPLPLSGPLPHDLCHGRDSSHWLPETGYLICPDADYVGKLQTDEDLSLTLE